MKLSPCLQKNLRLATIRCVSPLNVFNLDTQRNAFNSSEAERSGWCCIEYVRSEIRKRFGPFEGWNPDR